MLCATGSQHFQPPANQPPCPYEQLHPAGVVETGALDSRATNPPAPRHCGGPATPPA